MVSLCWLMFQPALSSYLERTSGGTGMFDKTFRDWSSALMIECSQTHPVPVLLWRHILLPWSKIARDQSHHPLFCTIWRQPANQLSCYVTKVEKSGIRVIIQTYLLATLCVTSKLLIWHWKYMHLINAKVVGSNPAAGIFLLLEFDVNYINFFQFA